MKNVKREPVDLDAVLNDLDLDNENTTTSITNPEEARAETQKVVNLLEQLLQSGNDDSDDNDDHGGDGGGGDGGGGVVGGGGDSGDGGGDGGVGGGVGGGVSGGSDGSSDGGIGGGVGGGIGGGVGGDDGESPQRTTTVQQNGMVSQAVTAAALIKATVAPTKPPLSQKQIQKATVSHLLKVYQYCISVKQRRCPFPPKSTSISRPC